MHDNIKIVRWIGDTSVQPQSVTGLELDQFPSARGRHTMTMEKISKRVATLKLLVPLDEAQQPIFKTNGLRDSLLQ